MYYNNLPDNTNAQRNNVINQSHGVISLEKTMVLPHEDLNLAKFLVFGSISVFQVMQI